VEIMNNSLSLYYTSSGLSYGLVITIAYLEIDRLNGLVMVRHELRVKKDAS
jgi:hypothetical protein